MDDVRAVMDAVGSRRAILLGISEGGPDGHALRRDVSRSGQPASCSWDRIARRLWAPDYPIGMRVEDAWWSDPSPETWGLPMARRFVDERAPSVAGDEETYRWYACYLMRGASPGAAVQLARMNAEIDVRHVLPTIHVPTLVLYREQEYLREAARYMGEHIPGAQIVALPGADHLPWEGAQSDVLREIEQFVEHLRAGPEPDRVLATVLVIEADGTEEACDAVRADVASFRGRELALTTDTLVAMFDGPARAIRCASTLLDLARSVGRPARAGLHTGEQELGADLLAGIPVSVARNLKERAESGEVLVSSTVRDLVAGSGLVFRRTRAGAASGGRCPGRVARPRPRRVTAPTVGTCTIAPATKSTAKTDASAGYPPNARDAPPTAPPRIQPTWAAAARTDMAAACLPAARSSPTALPRYVRAPARKQRAPKPIADGTGPTRTTPNATTNTASSKPVAASSGRPRVRAIRCATNVPGM